MSDRLETRIARLLSVGALVAVALLTIGIVLMATNGISPDVAAYPTFDPATVVADLLSLEPAGFLWAGLIVVVATPVVRVVGEIIAFSIRRDRPMALVAVGTLAVIVVSIVTALAAEG